MSIDEHRSFEYWFQPHTSHIDWCEQNYQVTDSIAEFYNTSTNVIFIFGPLCSFVLFRQYSKNDAFINLIFGLMLLTGLGSMYFHATLSYAGQVIDELAIMWVILLGIAAYTPKVYYNNYIATTTFRLSIMTFAAAVSIAPYSFGAGFSKIVAFTELASGIPIAMLVAYDLSAYRALYSHDGVMTARNAIGLFAIAAPIWLMDRLLCDYTSTVPLQLHAVFHVIMYIAAHLMVTFMAYRTAITTLPELGPEIRFFPSDMAYGIPYVAFQLNKHK
eukprot:CFRG4191T1